MVDEPPLASFRFCCTETNPFACDFSLFWMVFQSSYREMQKITVDQYIEQRLDDQQAYYSKAARKAQKSYFTIKVSETILAATIPFLSAMITPETIEIKIAVGAIGVLVTIAGGVLLLYKYHENWVNYRSTAEALKTQKFLFLAKAGPYKGRNREVLLVENIESLLGEEHQKWMQYMLQKDQEQENTDVNAAEQGQSTEAPPNSEAQPKA
jgi:hypothetical protein